MHFILIFPVTRPKSSLCLLYCGKKEKCLQLLKITHIFGSLNIYYVASGSRLLSKRESWAIMMMIWILLEFKGTLPRPSSFDVNDFSAHFSFSGWTSSSHDGSSSSSGVVGENNLKTTMKLIETLTTYIENKFQDNFTINLPLLFNSGSPLKIILLLLIPQISQALSRLTMSTFSCRSRRRMSEQ